ncbi:Arginyl-tRNA synthetase [Gryganskiella cystojenkinii]|nr:Arginyl-tRNA synthetase [Gryganskiella cystojenkinii]
MSGSGDNSHAFTVDSSTPSILTIYKTEIATILSPLIDRPVQSILPCIQYQTKARAGSGAKNDHSPFSVPVQRLLSLPYAGSEGTKPKDGKRPRGRRTKGQEDSDSDSEDPAILLAKRHRETKRLLERVQVAAFDEEKNGGQRSKSFKSVSLDKSQSLLLFDPIPHEFVQRTCQALYRELEEPKDQQRRRTNSLESTHSSTVLGKRSRHESDDSQKLVIVNANPIADEDPYSSLRRIALGGFISRLLNSQRVSSQIGDRVGIASGKSVTVLEPTASLDEYNQLLGLEENLYPEYEQGSEWAYEKIKHALTTNPATLATRNELDGFWYVDLSAVNYGRARVYLDTTATLEFEKPSPLILALVQLAHHMEAHRLDCSRYLWVIPEGRNHFADQVLCLGRLIFKDHLVGNADLVTQKEYNQTKKNGLGAPAHELQGFWTDIFEVVVYEPSTGPDLWKQDPKKSEWTPTYGRDIRGLIDYARVRMKEVVVKNRGSLEDMDDDGDDGSSNSSSSSIITSEGQVLDATALYKMATVLSTSALIAASVGSRRRKQIRIDMNKVMDGKGNSGVFLQYVHSRLCGIERNSNTRLNPEADLSLLEETPEAYALTLALVEYEDLLTPTSVISVNMDPSPFILYLFNVAAAVGQANRTMRVKGMRTDVAEARWLLFWCAKRVLDRGLWLLGLEPIGMM